MLISNFKVLPRFSYQLSHFLVITYQKKQRRPKGKQKVRKSGINHCMTSIDTYESTLILPRPGEASYHPTHWETELFLKLMLFFSHKQFKPRMESAQA